MRFVPWRGALPHVTLLLFRRKVSADDGSDWLTQKAGIGIMRNNITLWGVFWGFFSS